MTTIMNKHLRDSYISKNCKGDTEIHLGYDEFGRKYHLASADHQLTDQQISFSVSHNKIFSRIVVVLTKYTNGSEEDIQGIYGGEFNLNVSSENKDMWLGLFRLVETKLFAVAKGINMLRCEFMPTQDCGTGIIDFVEYISNEI